MSDLALISTRQLCKKRRKRMERSLTTALTPEQARSEGLASITQPFSMRRWDIASKAILLLDDIKESTPHRKPCFVKVRPQSVEIWARP